MLDREHRYWHRRGYLPHFDAGAIVQALTFRLADSLPKRVVEQLNSVSDLRVRFRNIETRMDLGVGACVLREPQCARIVESALHHFDGKRYRLLAWVVMPNHVHLLIEQMAGWPLERLIHSWKSFTAKEINRARGTSGSVWARDYYDRFVRDGAHFENALAYIRNNPVKAGLVGRSEDWPWIGPKTLAE
jgi:REP element-mobilizing transposase RayT